MKRLNNFSTLEPLGMENKPEELRAKLTVCSEYDSTETAGRCNDPGAETCSVMTETPTCSASKQHEPYSGHFCTFRQVRKKHLRPRVKFQLLTGRTHHLGKLLNFFEQDPNLQNMRNTYPLKFLWELNNIM